MPDSYKPHHPLPKDDRARHDLIPESVENERPLGDDDPDAAPASTTEPPERRYRDPANKPYRV
jgi:hypothetical protein